MTVRALVRSWCAALRVARRGWNRAALRIKTSDPDACASCLNVALDIWKCLIQKPGEKMALRNVLPELLVVITAEFPGVTVG